MDRDDQYREAAKSAAREFAKWPAWKKSPPSVPVEREKGNGSSGGKKDKP